MPSWWRQRKERHQQVSRDANLIALFGERACSAVLARARHEDETDGDPSHWFAVRREIGRRAGKDVGLDTGARYLGQ